MQSLWERFLFCSSYERKLTHFLPFRNVLCWHGSPITSGCNQLFDAANIRFQIARIFRSSHIMGNCWPALSILLRISVGQLMANERLNIHLADWSIWWNLYDNQQWHIGRCIKSRSKLKSCWIFLIEDGIFESNLEHASKLLDVIHVHDSSHESITGDHGLRDKSAWLIRFRLLLLSFTDWHICISSSSTSSSLWSLYKKGKIW